MTTHNHDELAALWGSMPWGNDIPMPTRDQHGWQIKFHDGNANDRSYFRVFHDGRLRAVLYDTDDTLVRNWRSDDHEPSEAHLVEHRPRR